MNAFEAHQLRNVLAVILGGIELDNAEMAKQAVRRANDMITAMQIPRCADAIAAQG